MGNGLQTGKPGCVNTKRGIQAASEWPQRDTVYAHARGKTQRFIIIIIIFTLDGYRAGTQLNELVRVYFHIYIRIYVASSWDTRTFHGESWNFSFNLAIFLVLNNPCYLFIYCDSLTRGCPHV